MRTKLVLPLVVLCICVIPSSDYAFGQKLYPVQGPIASQAAPPVFSGQIRRPMFTGKGILPPTFLAGNFGRESSLEVKGPFSRWRYWTGNTARR